MLVLLCCSRHFSNITSRFLITNHLLFSMSRFNRRGNRDRRDGAGGSRDYGFGRDHDDMDEGSRRPPRGLRGKEIGKFYANKQRSEEKKERRRNPETKGLSGREIGLYHAQRQKENQWKKPLTIILLSDSRKAQIKRMLDSCTPGGKHLTDNAFVQHMWFKSEFLSIINGSILDKIEMKTNSFIPRPSLDDSIYEQFKKKENDPSYLSMLRKRQKLPSFSMKEKILKLVEENQVVVISGETGCGKTTQVAQFILDDFIEKKQGSMCSIVCTQPRRISAIAVAERVADERAERLGLSVGYQIRLEKKMPRERGSVCFCTTGVVLKKMEMDPSLSSFSHIILDEIHERNVPSDFLITLLKKVIRHRKDLKVILMSATLNSEAFSKYYNNAPHINIPGFTYPVEEYYLEDVLEKTHYSFAFTRESGRDKPIWKKKADGSWKQQKEFSDFIMPYIRQLESERKYSRQTIQELQSPQSEVLDVNLIFELLLHICSHSKDDGAILVFVTGYMEISSLHRKIEDSSYFPRSKYLVFPLHSLMPTVEQKQIFQPAPPGKRKIIIATNIAETSITIDDVVFVVDCGRIKMSDFNVAANQETLAAEWVSLANASQRRGRAGRVKPGVCYHLYSKAREMTLEQFQKPEILRQRLEDVILQAKMLQLGKVETFFKELMDPPEDEALNIALDLLKRLNALDDDENLTPLGYHLARLPMAPQLGKMVLFGAIFSCLNPILSVAVSLDFKDAFQIPLSKEKEADKRRLELSANSKSDHLLLHKAIEEYETCDRPREFCWDYFLSMPTLKLLQNLKRDFMSYLYEMSFVSNLDPKSPAHNVNSDNLSLVKAIICAGLYPNIGCVRKRTVISVDQEKMKFHPKSVLSKETSFDSPLIAYYRRIKSTSFFIHDATMVHPLPVVFFGDHFENNLMDNGHHNISINKKLRFKCTESSAEVIEELRNRLNQFLEHKVSNPGHVDWREDREEIWLLSAIMNLITVEETGDFDLSDYDDYE